MTLKQRTNYLRIGLGLAEVVASEMTCELIIRTYEGILEKKGEYSLEDAVKLQVEIEKKYKKKKK